MNGCRTEGGLSLGVDSVAWCSASTTREALAASGDAQVIDVFVTSRLTNQQSIVKPAGRFDGQAGTGRPTTSRTNCEHHDNETPAYCDRRDRTGSRPWAEGGCPPSASMARKHPHSVGRGSSMTLPK